MAVAADPLLLVAEGGRAADVALDLAQALADDLARDLKRACGTGGTIKDGTIEIQGEHRQKIAEVLRKDGYQVKIAGG